MARRGFGLIPDAPDGRDHVYRSAAATSELPAAVDLRAGFGPARDQGETHSCVGFALAGLLEFCGARKAARSPLFIYYEGRLREGRVGQDRGVTFRSALQAVTARGACREALHPFAAANVLRRPSAAAYEDAPGCRAAGYARLIGLGEVKRALADGRPVLLGVAVTQGLLEPTEGRVAVPDARERRFGWHAVLAVGYDDAAGELLLRNSWGADYGCGGYVYAPYAFVQAGAIGDLWVVTLR